MLFHSIDVNRSIELRFRIKTIVLFFSEAAVFLFSKTLFTCLSSPLYFLLSFSLHFLFFRIKSSSIPKSFSPNIDFVVPLVCRVFCFSIFLLPWSIQMIRFLSVLNLNFDRISFPFRFFEVFVLALVLFLHKLFL